MSIANCDKCLKDFYYTMCSYSFCPKCRAELKQENKKKILENLTSEFTLEQLKSNKTIRRKAR